MCDESLKTDRMEADLSGTVDLVSHLNGLAARTDGFGRCVGRDGLPVLRRGFRT
jgi:hypothetical protein